MTRTANPISYDPVAIMKAATQVINQRGLSAADVGRATGYTRSHISRMMTGERVPTIAAALLIAHAVGIATIDLGDRS